MDRITEQYVKRSIALLRAAEGDAREVLRVFTEMNARIRKIIETRYKSVYNRGQLADALQGIREEMGNFYNTYLPAEFTAIGKAVIASELAWQAKELVAAIGDASKVATPLNQAAIARARGVEYQGKTFDRWIKESYSSNFTKIQKQMELGFSQGKSIAETTTQVMKVAEGSAQDAKKITRAFFMHNAAEAKAEMFEKNKNVIEGSIWNSTLDSRTTPLICGIRDQKEYDNKNQPVGHSLPWLGGPGRAHWGCRSIRIPKIKGVSATYNRPAIGAGDEYERGDNVTNRGTVRKLSKKAVDDGIYEVKQVTTNTTFEGFLKGQSKHNIDYVSDILGSKEKAVAFRDGKVTLKELAMENPANNPTNRNHL